MAICSTETVLARASARGPRLIGAISFFAVLPPVIAQEYSIDTPPEIAYVDLEARFPRLARELRYAVGVAANSSPEYAGSSGRQYSLKPIAAIQYGRFRISSSGGSGILNFGGHDDSSGASAELIDNPKLKLKLSARLGGGRSSADSAELDGLDDISRTVLLRLSGSYLLTEHLSLNSTFSWDALGRGNGATWSAGLSWATMVSNSTQISTGFGLTYANQTHMNGLFSVPESAARPDRPAFQAQAGMKDIGLGAGFMTALNKRWVTFGNVGYNYLLGSAADSPLTHGRGGASASIGIGYRCCK